MCKYSPNVVCKYSPNAVCKYSHLNVVCKYSHLNVVCKYSPNVMCKYSPNVVCKGIILEQYMVRSYGNYILLINKTVTLKLYQKTSYAWLKHMYWNHVFVRLCYIQIKAELDVSPVTYVVLHFCYLI